MAVQVVRNVLNEDDFLKADDVIGLKEHFVGVRVPSTSVWAHRAPGLASCLRGDLDYWLPWSTQGPGFLGCPSFLVYPVPHGVCSFYGLNLISDSLELDLNPNHREALGTEDNKSNRQHLLHCFSLCSTRQGSSHTGGIQPNSQQGECEMSVDEPTLQYDSVGRHLVASGAAAAVRTHGTTVEVEEAENDRRGDQYVLSLDNKCLLNHTDSSRLSHPANPETAHWWTSWFLKRLALSMA
ncbi:uncharacterized protein LOC134485030 [Rattus norvegicus]|uniref:uncharacterized protein LOC134485030 n=1 Tax=Rattus norvegicus TaxID=10116 RepID=UPI002FD85D5A